MNYDEQKILFINKEQISSHTPDELHSLQVNKWNNWWCSVGMRSIYVHHDGLIYRGTCQVGGSFGSIYNQGIDNMEDLFTWVKCDKDICACGTDMQTPKVKSYDDISVVTPKKIKNLDLDALTPVDLVKDPTISFCGVFKEYKLVIWELGRRCNYDCWYCFPDSHNNYEGHKTLGSLKQGLKNLSAFWGAETKMKFVFTGGEPTFNPDYLEFVEHLHNDLFHIVHTTTNGSHTPEYYKKLMKVSDIGFSAHLTYLERPEIYKKFIKNIMSAQESKLSDPDANMNWMGVRIMLQPGKLELAKQLYEDVKAITNNITVDLIHDKNKKVLPYFQEEIQWTNEKNSLL